MSSLVLMAIENMFTSSFSFVETKRSYGKISNTIFLGFVSHFVSHFVSCCFVLLPPQAASGKKTRKFGWSAHTAIFGGDMLADRHDNVPRDLIMMHATCVAPGGVCHTQRPQATPQSNGNCATVNVQR